jgi:hypothetical protein
MQATTPKRAAGTYLLVQAMNLRTLISPTNPNLTHPDLERNPKSKPTVTKTKMTKRRSVQQPSRRHRQTARQTNSSAKPLKRTLRVRKGAQIRRKAGLVDGLVGRKMALPALVPSRRSWEKRILSTTMRI